MISAINTDHAIWHTDNKERNSHAQTHLMTNCIKTLKIAVLRYTSTVSHSTAHHCHYKQKPPRFFCRCTNVRNCLICHVEMFSNILWMYGDRMSPITHVRNGPTIYLYISRKPVDDRLVLRCRSVFLLFVPSPIWPKRTENWSMVETGWLGILHPVLVPRSTFHSARTSSTPYLRSYTCLVTFYPILFCHILSFPPTIPSLIPSPYVLIFVVFMFPFPRHISPAVL